MERARRHMVGRPSLPTLDVKWVDMPRRVDMPKRVDMPLRRKREGRRKADMPKGRRAPTEARITASMATGTRSAVRPNANKTTRIARISSWSPADV